MDQPDAKKTYSWTYFPKLFFANKYVEYVVIAILAAFIGKILLPELTEFYKLIFRKWKELTNKNSTKSLINLYLLPRDTYRLENPPYIFYSNYVEM